MPMTQAERDAEDAKTAAEKPLRDWQKKMNATDTDLPRAIEDILDALDPPTKAKIPKHTMDKYNNKKLLRNQKP